MAILLLTSLACLLSLLALLLLLLLLLLLPIKYAISCLSRCTSCYWSLP
jgi:hypothetical protein